MYNAIDTNYLENKLKTLTSKDFIILTLIDGDTLLGAIFKHWKMDWDGTIFQLSFNTSDGKQFGHSIIVDIPVRLIADISIFPLADTSIPKMSKDELLSLEKVFGTTIEIDTRLYVVDYPNPLASIIHEHNLPIIKSHQLKESGYVENALSQKAVPPDGFDFDSESNVLLYSDWDFFNTQARGHTNISISIGLSIGKNFKPSMEEQVMQLLRNSLTAKLAPKIAPRIGQYGVAKGCLLVAEPNQDSVIEGDDGNLYMLVQENGVTHPVFLKEKYLKIPKEFLKPIKSLLTVYGEFLPIPTNIGLQNFNNTLLVRAVAHLS